MLARSIFKHTRKLYKSDKKVASGLLMIRSVNLGTNMQQLRLSDRGEDFSDNFTNPVTAYHRLIKSMFVWHQKTRMISFYSMLHVGSSII